MKIIYFGVRLIAMLFIGIGKLIKFFFWDMFYYTLKAVKLSKYWEQRILGITAITILFCLYYAWLPVYLMILFKDPACLFLLMFSWVFTIAPYKAMSVCFETESSFDFSKVTWGAGFEIKKIKKVEYDSTDPDYIEARKELDEYLKTDVYHKLKKDKKVIKHLIEY
jgi:hypothetical protein